MVHAINLHGTHDVDILVFLWIFCVPRMKYTPPYMYLIILSKLAFKKKMVDPTIKFRQLQ